MRSWPVPAVPSLSGDGIPLSLYDTADDEVRRVRTDWPSGEVGIYVCGITPYDSTHLGHAATYVTFDLVHRQLLDNGHRVHFVENITDVDDPLFERAERDGVDWRDLGTSQINLFRSDMEALSVIPPREYIGAMESVNEVIDLITRLLEVGAAYILDDEYADIYVDHTFTPRFGYESRYDALTMAEFFAERGGDPERAGKRHPLDALVWRVHRDGEPAWEAPFGAGRPGWHVECSAIATNRLGSSFAIQGGGRDLRFPHHEFSAAHAEAALGCERMADHYVHTGMIGLDGTKMSKSLGNLVFVSKLTAAGHDPSAVRLGLYVHHYREDRDWSDAVLDAAEARLARWRDAAAVADALPVDIAAPLVGAVRQALADDLDTPTVLHLIDSWCDTVVPETGATESPATGGAGAGAELRTLCDALLGVRL
ncbi:cysteine--1-D-myo-inosityl 2-amino-2-deoxy-alpha-D-glucopyranoside ligase [Corynebacterium terpenotabidum]|uniref:L-cysteine:1D-myo-inositol 2-amino-2-deoxy-alpha-D-glucopyranoside ligase n=1 Tax=Corynebacterium terpenotabidum Y-11 TaxID=1200352 RepID=S4XDZ5_9CORY|nr:cysteine--1-D-myo-inosityl 2-amino-2-deoxy-alpha-D-glucopyranoside ligase [Corynebacterium terpenotabidum]AGP30769.1 cysteine--1-D-myo-inosityl 2-amino-2-deoxy-alpha-D-glucopyranoside ligase [Corynebacterium terpenotabidum Y-11]